MDSRYDTEWGRDSNSRFRGKGKGWKKRSDRGRGFGHDSGFQDRSSRGEQDRERVHHPRGRGKRDHDRDRRPPDGGEQDHERVRPPPGLRGREIGLWYARQSRGKRNTARNEEYKNRAFIVMDSRQEHQISDLLKNLQSSDVAGQNPRRYKPITPDSSDDDSDCDASVKEGSQDLKTLPKPTAGQSSRVDYFDFSNIDESHFNQMSLNPDLPPKSKVPKLCSEEEPGCSRQLSSNRSDLDPVIDIIDVSSDDNTDEDDCVEDFNDELDDVIANLDVENVDADSELGDARKYDSDEADVEVITIKTEEEEISDFMLEMNSGLKDLSLAKCKDYNSLPQDKDLDNQLLNESRAKQSNRAYQKMLQWRQKLPSFEKQQEILSAIDRNQVVVISGETGSGKTTQVTQFILDSWIEKRKGSLCRVVCTQPRRISAISVAERVADERAEPLGKSVGYQIRLEKSLPRTQGSILYCTTGIMLKWLETDPWLASTSHVILDEVHERDILCDFLMIILRDLLQQRRDLKLILMSATMNAESFSEYFGNCPMVNIPGYTFPVQEYFAEDVIEMIHFVPDKNQQRKPKFSMRGKNIKEERQKMDEYQRWVGRLDMRKYCRNTVDVLRSLTFDSNDINYDLVAALVHFIAVRRPEGAILVFVPGWEQIRKVMESLDNLPMFATQNFKIIPLHSLMPTVNQREVFDRPPHGQRKIVIATNIAETSITIDDVVYVIDCGTMKLKQFDVTNNLSTLQPEWISRANAKQRRGRAGRVCPGECFHLYTSFHYTLLDDFQLPEMLRTRLEELCLQIKLLKRGKIEDFASKAMQPPSSVSLQLAIALLRDLNALDEKEELTPLGYHLAKMPVDPHSGKMLLFAAMFSCLDPILTIAASLSFKAAFYVPMGHEKTADERKRQLSNRTKSDHLLLVNAYEGWERAKAERDVYNYCRYNYLSVNTLQMLCNMRKQFVQLLYDMGFVTSLDPKSPMSNRNSGNVNLVKAIVCAGLYPNVARLKPIKNIHSKRPLVLHTKPDQSVYVHPKSVNYAEREFPSQWFVFHLKMKTAKIYLYDCSPVSPYPLLFFGGNIACRKDLGQNCIIVDDWIKFGASRRVANLVQELRLEFDRLMERKVTNPCPTNWDRKSQEGALMHTIADLLTTTEESCLPRYANRKN